MPLSPDAAAFVAGPMVDLRFPRAALSDPEVSAAFLARSRVSAPKDNSQRCPVKSVDEIEIADGVAVRVYVPEGEGPFPVLVYIHGGGWIAGDLDQHDLTCRMLAANAGMTVVNVGYRLAPEHPFPGPLDDCYAALLWAEAHAAEFSGDPSRLVVAGSSSGGNLAAAVALRARDERGPRIALQVLIYPVIDSRMTAQSYDDEVNGRDYYIDRPQMEWFWSLYVQDERELGNPLASPGHAASLENLPPAIVITAEFDLLRDEGEAYAHRLAAEGNGAELIRYPGQIHGFMGLFDVVADARIAVLDLASRLRERFESAR